MFTVEFSTDNDAFQDNLEGESSAILNKVVSRVRMGETSGSIHDANGNKIGQWSLR